MFIAFSALPLTRTPRRPTLLLNGDCAVWLSLLRLGQLKAACCWT